MAADRAASTCSLRSRWPSREWRYVPLAASARFSWIAQQFERAPMAFCAFGEFSEINDFRFVTAAKPAAKGIESYTAIPSATSYCSSFIECNRSGSSGGSGRAPFMQLCELCTAHGAMQKLIKCVILCNQVRWNWHAKLSEIFHSLTPFSHKQRQRQTDRHSQPDL